MKYLESNVETTITSKVDVTNQSTFFFIYFFLHLHSISPAIFGGFARYLLIKIMKKDGKIIHFVVDK
jgi:hypothetical protein